MISETPAMCSSRIGAVVPFECSDSVPGSGYRDWPVELRRMTKGRAVGGGLVAMRRGGRLGITDAVARLQAGHLVMEQLLSGWPSSTEGVRDFKAGRPCRR